MMEKQERQEENRKEQRNKATKKEGEETMKRNFNRTVRRRRLRGLLGTTLAVLSVVACVPMRAEAAGGSCGASNSAISCDKYDQDVSHYHMVEENGATITAGYFPRKTKLTNGVISGGKFDSLELNAGNKVTGGIFTECKLSITGSSQINGVKIKEVVLQRDATNAKLEDVTITGPLEIELGNREDAKPTFKHCTFQGDVTIKNGGSSSSVTFEDCTFKGTVTLSTPVTITMNQCKLKNAPTVSSGSVISSDGDIYTVTFVDEQGAVIASQMLAGVKNAEDPYGGTWYLGTEVYDFNSEVTGNLVLTRTPYVEPPVIVSSGSSVTTGGARSASASGSAEGQESGSEPVNQIPSHSCQYEWVTVREAGAGVDGEQRLMCRLCGSVQSVLTIPAASGQTTKLYDTLSLAGEGEEVTYDFEELHTISDKLFTTLQNRKDLSLRITFTYKGRNYETTFPADADYTELLEDEASFYGLLGLSGRCGIVTRDVTPEEQTGADMTEQTQAQTGA